MVKHTVKSEFPDPSPFGAREGFTLEFKEAADTLPRSFFETVCAFLNLDGGLIVLGVADDGTVTGVVPVAVDRLKAEIASLSNNPNKLNTVRADHARKYGFIPGFEQIVSGGSMNGPSFAERAKARWQKQMGGEKEHGRHG